MSDPREVRRLTPEERDKILRAAAEIVREDYEPGGALSLEEEKQPTRKRLEELLAVGFMLFSHAIARYQAKPSGDWLAVEAKQALEWMEIVGKELQLLDEVE